LGRKTTSPDARGPPVSDARERKVNAALARFAGPAAGFGPRRDATRALGDGPRGRGSGGELEQAAVKKLGFRAENEEMKIFIFFFFFFLFKYYKAFSNDFESKFKFKSNHSSQIFKCNSMNAQSCFYTYI
jgi:hypothetical protein